MTFHNPTTVGGKTEAKSASRKLMAMIYGQTPILLEFILPNRTHIEC